MASTRPVKNLQQEQVRAYVLYDFLEKVSESEFRSCVKVEVAVPGSLSLMTLMVSMDTGTLNTDTQNGDRIIPVVWRAL